MKYLAVLSAVVAVSASVVYNVSDFSTGCIPHSFQCYYSFHVLQDGTSEIAATAVYCQAYIVSDGSLPNVTDAPCVDSSRTFSVAHIGDGWCLSVTEPITPSSNLTGTHLLGIDEVVRSTAPNAAVQTYVGPTTFTLDD